MLTIKLTSQLPVPNSTLYTVYQLSTELEFLCGTTANCWLWSWLLQFLDHTQSVALLCTVISSSHRPLHFVWRYSKLWAVQLTVAVSRSHTVGSTPLYSDQSVTQAATYTTRNKHNRRISVPSGGFEPATPAIKRPHNYNLDCTVIRDGRL